MSGLPNDLQPDLRQDVGAEPDHAALGDRGHRDLRGVQALGGRAQPRLALRRDDPHRAPRATRTSASTRSAARRGSYPRGNAAYIYGSHFLHVHLRSVRRRHAARDVAHVGRLRAAVRDQPPDREGRRQAVHRAVRRLEGLPARSLRHAGDGGRAPRPRRPAARSRRPPRRTCSPQYTRRRPRARTGCSTTATRSRTVRAMPVGGDATARARRRADRRDGPVRRARRRLARLRAGPASYRRGLRVTGPVPLGRAHAADRAAHARPARARSGGVARRPAHRVLAERALRERARGDGPRARRAGRRSCGAASATTRRTSRRGRPTARASRSRRGASGGFRDILVVERRDRQGRRGHARSRDRHAAGVVARRPHALLRQRPHRHLEHLRVRHAPTARLWQVTNVLGGAFSAASRRPTASASRSIASVPKGGYDLFELADRSRARGCPRATTSTIKPPPVDRPRRRGRRSPRRARTARSRSLAPQAWTLQLDDRRRRSATHRRPAAPTRSACTATRSRSASTSTTATSTSARRTATSASCRRCALAAARTLARARRLAHRRRQPAASSEEDWSATLSVGIPFESRPGVELDAVVRLRRRLVPPRRGSR